MTKDKGIFIKNIYYMLAYAFRILRQKNYDEIAAEEFDDIQDLFAVILAKGVSQQLKQGLHKEYITKNICIDFMKNLCWNISKGIIPICQKSERPK